MQLARISNDTYGPDASKNISEEKQNKIVIFNIMGKNDMDLSDKYCEKFMLQISLIYNVLSIENVSVFKNSRSSTCSTKESHSLCMVVLSWSVCRFIYMLK